MLTLPVSIPARSSEKENWNEEKVVGLSDAGTGAVMVICGF